MKLLIAILGIVSAFFLTGCDWNELQYNDFEDHAVTSYYEAEHKSTNRYILYYFDSTKSESDMVKSEVLEFFKDFTLLEFYLLDTSIIETETSSFGGYLDQPIIYVVSSNDVYEEYSGANEISEFIATYSTIEFDYDLFADQHLNSVYDTLTINNSDYIVYYYLEDCTQCIEVQPSFLRWAFTKSVEDIYFINGDEVETPETFPTELHILQSGTPMLIVMSYGTYADESYSDEEDVIGYVNRIGTDDIIASNLQLDYDDFSDYALTSYDQTLTISDNVHIEYYYSPYCSHCNSIKSKVLTFFMNLTDEEFYIINASEATGLPKIENFSGVPALYIVANNQVVDEFIGSIEVPAFIDDYIAGEIDLTEYE